MPDLTVWPTDGADGSVSSEARWRKMGRGWQPSGVDMSLLAVGGPGGLVPTLVAGPTINVSAGSCWVDGHFGELATPTSVPASANGLLVVRFTPADNHMELLYRDAATTCQMTLATWELPIAQMVAGAIRDLRWPAGPSGEIAVVVNGATVNITSAHTQASPIDVADLPAVYCDGAPLDVIFSAGYAGGVAPAGGFMRIHLWVDGAEMAAATNSPLALVSVGTVTVYHRIRYTPTAGVHRFRARAYGTSGVTAGQVAGPITLRLVRP